MRNKLTDLNNLLFEQLQQKQLQSYEINCKIQLAKRVGDHSKVQKLENENQAIIKEARNLLQLEQEIEQEAKQMTNRQYQEMMCYV